MLFVVIRSNIRLNDVLHAFHILAILAWHNSTPFSDPEHRQLCPEWLLVGASNMHQYIAEQLGTMQAIFQANFLGKSGNFLMIQSLSFPCKNTWPTVKNQLQNNKNRKNIAGVRSDSTITNGTVDHEQASWQRENPE